MKRSIDLDDDLAAEINHAAAVVREKPATVIRLAIRAGLPSVTNRFQSPQPEAYQDSSRAKLEDAIAKATVQHPER